MKRTRKTILLATDFSRLSLAAFPLAVDAAKRERSRLLIFHVLPPPVTGDALRHVPVMMYEEMKAAVLRRAAKKLEALVGRARRRKVRATSQIVEGLAPEEILRTAKRLRARLIVMGTHGRSGLTGLLLGSVAMRVIGGASCPVLTVRARS
jgi:nucleotide-binding universal stress UspA family protein